VAVTHQRQDHDHRLDSRDARHARPQGAGVWKHRYPLVSLYGEADRQDVLVCEVSSFQLANIEEFKRQGRRHTQPRARPLRLACGMEDYAAAKARLIENMSADDFLVFNADDEFCVSLASGRGERLSASEGSLLPGRASTWTERPSPPRRHWRRPLMDSTVLKLAGAHNVDNVMAAAAASLALGRIAPTWHSRLVLRGVGAPLRAGGAVRGVEFFNDSKATNPHATLHA